MSLPPQSTLISQHCRCCSANSALSSPVLTLLPQPHALYGIRLAYGEGNYPCNNHCVVTAPF